MELLENFFYMALGLVLFIGVGVISDKIFRKDKNYHKESSFLELLVVGFGCIFVLLFVFYLAS